MERIEKLEKEIGKIRYDLMIKGGTLDFLKENITLENKPKINNLENEIKGLKSRLLPLQTEISKLKYRYFVSYEVTYINIWLNEPQKEIYNEVFYLNENTDIDFPAVTKDHSEERFGKFLLELFALLSNKYSKVSLLIVKRV